MAPKPAVKLLSCRALDGPPEIKTNLVTKEDLSAFATRQQQQMAELQSTLDAVLSSQLATEQLARCSPLGVELRTGMPNPCGARLATPQSFQSSPPQCSPEGGTYDSANGRDARS
jgi:hypothetical protein